ncbi:NAD(+) kinase [Psychrobium sp. 1_MG-2023]|uniref:NAD(+) kinase n=1 Tax=Psychrobium sp. 1_MG-2023 TaxID=3062624 RepID=UPI000C3486AF|nr:NAD(+) kinase [Psychrobium sp. 1_MG-2023]MDP2561246.1 NAD(+) kinase [Psychrobium sp. 1_MG-2023]PKF55252.1 NAD(+) kinase [Alteromonadales bacterium alter-6D02]
MKRLFNCIGLIGKTNHSETSQTIEQLHQLLCENGYDVIVDERSAIAIAETLNVTKAPLIEIGERCDLAIVIGGDGNMLGAARVLARYDIAVVGVNRGNLGFLTDIDPDNIQEPLLAILDGKFITEKRFLLEAQIFRHGVLKSCNTAMNEVVLHAAKVANMIEFELFIDGLFVYHQRSDGLITSTPTGSTAYSLSGGGPILTPNMDAISLVPMFPHTLSSRPIVIDGNSQIELKIPHYLDQTIQVSCDGQVSLEVLPGDQIMIQKSDSQLRLIHPIGYSYYEVLRSKLSWSEQRVTKKI